MNVWNCRQRDGHFIMIDIWMQPVALRHKILLMRKDIYASYSRETCQCDGESLRRTY
jgi:hypothetical protein